MTSRNRTPPLTVVGNAPLSHPKMGEESSELQSHSAAHDVDWSILMARAQDGDGTAYRRLLEEVTPYLRSLAGRRHRDPHDLEDAVQDVLLTIHLIRYTYDPTRPFGPWLVAIANRRLIDRLRRQGRMRAREAAFTSEHATFLAPQANLEDTSDRYRLETAVENLPPSQRQAIRLLKLKDMSLEEAARASGMSVASLKVATHRALKNLRKMFANRSET